MEFNNCSNVSRVAYRNTEKDPSPQHLFIEVVMINKSHDLSHPLLYQVRSDRPLDDQKEFLSDMWSSFSLIGEVLSINKEKRQIQATNEISVSYCHLIVVSGLKANNDHDLSKGLYALLEALRVRNNVPQNFFPTSVDSSKPQHVSHKGKSPHVIPNKNILHDMTKILSLKSTSGSSITLDMAFANKHMRFYEIQLSRKNEGGL